MADVAMPRLSDSMEEGTILKWLVADGDAVSKGDEIAEIETDKANMTFEADQDGTLEIVAEEGDTLAVGETIARIGEGARSSGQPEAGAPEAEADEPAPEAPMAEAPEPQPQAPEAEAPEPQPRAPEAEAPEPQPQAPDAEAPDPQPEAPEAEADQPGRDAPESDAGGGNGRVKASPIARRMARDMGLELAGVTGTGPSGRIVKADVEAVAKSGEPEPAAPQPAAPEPAPAPLEAQPSSGDARSGRGEITHQDLTRLQRTVARRMAESKATAPDFVMTLEVDMERAVEFRASLKAAAGDGPAPSFNDLVIKASALALRDFPRANGAYRDGAFELYSRVNVGIAVAGQDALVVPTVFDADGKSLGTIAAESRRLAERVRDGRITPPELSGGTFTISNLGMFGIKRFVAVINPPQAAILAVGELAPRPVERDGEIAIRAVMELTLSCDHRILYGADAASFLGRIREYLETPLKLAL